MTFKHKNNIVHSKECNLAKKSLLFCILLAVFNVFIFAQTHIAVPLGHAVYIVIEQAQMRGLCRILPNAKPYSRSQILLIIDEILAAGENRFGSLTETERRVLEQFKKDFSPPREGLDLTRGTISFEHIWNDIYFSGQFGFGMDMRFSGSYYSIAGGYKERGRILDPLNTDPDPENPDMINYETVHPAQGDNFFSYEIMPSLSFIGDLGRNISYGLTLGIWAGKNPRTTLGTYLNTLPPEHKHYQEDETVEPRDMITYSEPLAHFPFTYKKRWDGYVWASGELTTGGMLSWPDGNVSAGYTMTPELAGTLLNGHIFYRFARLDREWAGMTNEGSLVLNHYAQPFLAFETVIQPFSWISFSSLTGVLEYHNAIGGAKAESKEVSAAFQNAFSIVMLEFNIKNYFHIGFGSSAVWPKRFELGYLFPFADNFIYQTNIGDFDNMALFLNAQAQYPGVGKLWASIYLDEMSISREFFQMAKMMFAYQFGASFHIPWMPFSSLRVSYTKVEPYNYTHIRIKTPWYDSDLMETNYVTFGKSLGHYIPPNSDELLIRYEVLPTPFSLLSLQYQMIRHGATYGDRAVAGSSLWSELLYHRDKIKKHFLQDGVYQWMHIFKLRGEYSFTGLKLPVKVFAEAGGIFSYFTDAQIFDDDKNLLPPNTGRGTFRIIDTPQYPHSLSFIASVGVRIFPKF